MFPVSIKGTAWITPPKAIDPESVVKAICEDLRRQRIEFTIREHEVEFRNPSFAIFPLNRYSGVDRGRFDVRAQSIDYDLSMKILVVLLSFSSALLGLLIAAYEARSILTWIAIPGFVWTSIVGINYAMVKWRSYSFIRQLLRQQQ